ncbi:GNAT family N-acetyltransferase [Pokkaliibacter sp. CJK22405]|uniref:GNAT family N-acetyltransferase n=1 Tax=Pokkaliibacter sp. CJK22405 TaxID=3384615 RepID=UPI0039847041
MTVEVLSSIHEIAAEDWNALLADAKHYPFLQHAFLAALEDSGAASAETGWVPSHLLWREDGQITAAMVLYQKHHSRGEYVFDYQWADAWEQAGGHYYPKLLCAVPFSPVTGPRLLGSAEGGIALLEVLKSTVLKQGISGAHVLFPKESAATLFESSGWLKRLGCQYHWYNRGYQHFDDFLTALNSRKRKNFRKERQQVQQQGIRFECLTSAQMTPELWQRFYQFYAATYLKRGQRPYLSLDFFLRLAESLPAAIRMVFALHEEKYVAAAFFLVGGDTLYGRYWGCLEEYDKLHFETCFYQGIELCIREGIACFDAGAQGEHKLIRGFEPQITYSWHFLQQGLHDAVADFLERESPAILAYAEEGKSYLPYRQDDAGSEAS